MAKLLRKTDADAEDARQEQLQQIRKKKWIVSGSVLAVVLAVTCYFAWGYLGKWRLGRDLNKALHFEQTGDYRRALLTLEQVVQVYPLNVEAKRRLASFYERAGQREAIDVWTDICRVEPEVAANWVGLATAALRMGDQATCNRALAKLRELGVTDGDYLRLATAAAVLLGDESTHETSLEALAKTAPDDVRVQFSLASLRLKSADPKKSEAARATLTKLAGNDRLRIRAIVELLSDVARRFPSNTPAREAELNALARVIAPAEGPRIDVAAQTSVDRLVGYAMTQPLPKPEEVTVLLTWMRANGWSTQALRWLDSLDVNVTQSPFVRAAAAESAFQVQDWRRLRPLVEAGAWGPIPMTAYDRAIALRAKWPNSAPATHLEWPDIVELCRTSPPGLRFLARLAKFWDWPDESRQVLQVITRDFPREAWAWHDLVSIAFARRDSELLWRTYTARSQAMPGDLSLQLEAGMIGLMTDRRGAPNVETTAEWLKRDPENAIAKVVHALALWRAKRIPEALELLQSLPRSAYAEPRFALVYGLVLSSANRPADSQQLLDFASAERLLPEETLLLEQARALNEARLGGASRSR